MVESTPNGHALQYADGTPLLLLGDTWYAAATYRFKWYGDDKARPIGPEAGFKDYVRLRKSQGYNWVNIIAAFPNWKTDDKPWHLRMEDAAHTTVRSAWVEFGSGSAATHGVGSAKNMDNEAALLFESVSRADPTDINVYNRLGIATGNRANSRKQSTSTRKR